MRKWIVVLAVATPLASIGGQRLEVGDRIRLTVHEAQAQQEAPATRRLVLRGQVTRILADSIYIRPAEVTSELGIETSSIKSMQRSRGVSRAATAARSAFFLAVTTALWAGAFHDRDNSFGREWEDAALVGAAVGAGTGIVLGVIFPTESWQRLRNWNR